MADLCTNRIWEKTTFTTGSYHSQKNLLERLLSGDRRTWFVGTVVGHPYGWLRNSTPEAANRRVETQTSVN